MEKRNYIDTTILEQMSVDELADLMVRASSILQQKLHHTDEPVSEISDLEKVEEEISDCDETCDMFSQDDEEAITETSVVDGEADIPLLDSLLGEKPEKSGDVLKVRLLDPMDLSSNPDWEIRQLGNEIVATDKSPNRQGGRIYSVDGVCPTITRTAPPKILVCNEPIPPTSQEVIEVEIPTERKPNPLW